MDKTHAGSISNIYVLEFAIFCIENVSTVLSVNAEKLYDALTKKSDILYKYIVPNYEILHTQGKEYIVEDIIAVMKEEGVDNDKFFEIRRERADMRANPILLQKKYARVVALFANMVNITMGEALDFFYHSTIYQLMRDGISDMHCMSDYYLAEDLEAEWGNDGEAYFVKKTS